MSKRARIFQTKQEFENAKALLTRPCRCYIKETDNFIMLDDIANTLIGKFSASTLSYTVTISDESFDTSATYYFYYCDNNGKILPNYDMIDKISNNGSLTYTLPFNEYNTYPKEADYIGVYNGEKELIGLLTMYCDKRSDETPLYKIGILSDIHDDLLDFDYTRLPNSYPPADEAQSDLARALSYFKTVEKVNMVCACGDLTQQNEAQAEINAPLEYSLGSNIIKNILGDEIPFFTCSGNHDMRDYDKRLTFFTDYQWNKLSGSVENYTAVQSEDDIADRCETQFSFDVTIGDEQVHMIFLSLWEDSSDSYHSEVINTYLQNQLEANKDKTTLLFMHCFLGDYNNEANFAGDFKRIYYTNGGWTIFDGGTSSTESKNEKNTTMLSYLATYPNLIVFNGHSHWKYELQKYESTANISQYKSGATMMHVSACGAPRDWNGSTGSIYRPLESQGLVMEIYSDHIIFKAIGFNSNVAHVYEDFETDTATLTTLYEPHKHETGKNYFKYIKYIPCGIYKIER